MLGRKKRPRPNRKKGENRNRSWNFLQWLTVFLRVTAGAVGVLVLSYGAIFLHDAVTQCDFFSAKEISVSGNHRLKNQEVLVQAGLYKGVNVLSVNISTAREQLKNNPWIREADVKRELPDRLFVTVTEQEPLAVVDLGDVFMLNTDGEIFKRHDTSDPEGLPLIHGLSINDMPLPGQEKNKVFQAVMEILTLGQKPDSILPNGEIRYIEVDHDLGLTLKTRQRFGVIKLGYDEYPKKYGLLRQILVHLSESRQVTQVQGVDLNDTSRIVVSPLEIPEPEQKRKDI
jgi:cell division protein FtsQ